MRVNFYATLREIVGKKTVEISLPEGSTVRQLITEITRRYPDLRRELLDEHGELLHHVHIFINGRDVPYLDNALESQIGTQDVVSVFPAVGGG